MAQTRSGARHDRGTDLDVCALVWPPWCAQTVAMRAVTATKQTEPAGVVVGG